MIFGDTFELVMRGAINWMTMILFVVLIVGAIRLGSKAVAYFTKGGKN